MNASFLALLLAGYLVGLAMWPIRDRLGLATRDGTFDGRWLWAFMFAATWPLLLLAALVAVFIKINRWRRAR